MTLHQFIKNNQETVVVMIRAGMLSSKCLIWYDMYEYVNANMVMKKKFRKSKMEIIADAAATFRTSTDTVKRAVNAMKQQIDYETARDKIRS